MISQLQSIRVFVDRKLSDLVLWPKCEADATSNADRGSAVIPVKGKRFKIESTSAYIDGPMGLLTLEDLETSHRISGTKGDALWGQIEAYIRRRASDLPAIAEALEAGETVRIIEPPTYADTRLPHLSQGVTFINDYPIGGTFELAALVTEVISPTEVSLTVFPKTGETFWRNNVGRRSSVQARNVWDFSKPAPMMIVPEGFELPDEINTESGEITWLKAKKPKKKTAA